MEARAKINLYLRVGERRPDGYHEIETVFHSITLADRLEIDKARDLQVTCSDPAVPSGPQNLVHRAAALLRETTGRGRGARIHIEKQIPSQAGLGGGSADAAAALRGLNVLWETGLEVEDLERLGARLGADVPFSVRGGAALATGIGEKLIPLPPLPPAWLVIVRPNAAISTRDAYTALDTLPSVSSPPAAAMINAVRSGDLRRVAALLYNDFERVALGPMPEVARAHAALRTLCSAVLLSGSGSAIFGMAENEAAACSHQEAMRARGWWSAVTRLAPADGV